MAQNSQKPFVNDIIPDIEICPEYGGGRLRAVAACAVAAGVLLVGASIINGESPIESKDRTDLEQPEITITEITPIDIGCFVKVSSEVELTAHQRNIVTAKVPLLPSVSITPWTNTTNKETKGESLLCVDNTNTKALLTEFQDGEARLDVTIGRLYPYGRIVHGSHNSTDFNPSLGERIGSFGFPDNDKVDEGLDFIGQAMIEQQSCLPAAVRLGKEQIQEHYDNLAKSLNPKIGDVQIDYVNRARPAVVDIPEGNVDDELAEMGLTIPENVDIIVEPINCRVTLVNGELKQQELAASQGKG